MEALLIIDIQKEFLTKDNFISPDPLVKNIKNFISKMRDNNNLVIWITADYGVWKERPKAVKLDRPIGNKYKDIPLNNKFLCGGHWGKRP